MSDTNSKSRGGRFDLPANELVENFNATITFEQRVCPFDIEDSKAHATMLARQQIISKEDAEAICRGLDQVAREIREGRFVFSVKDEDIHMAIEKRMTEIVGPAGGRLRPQPQRPDDHLDQDVPAPRNQGSAKGDPSPADRFRRYGRKELRCDHAGLHPHADGPTHPLCALDDGLLLDARTRSFAL